MATHVIIGVHGLSKKPPESQHCNDWISAIREGLARNSAVTVASEQLSFRLVYWAGWLNREPYGPGEDDEPYKPVPGMEPFLPYRQRLVDVGLRDLLDRVADPVDWVTSNPSVDWIRQHTGLDDVGVALLQKRIVDLGTYYGDAEKRAMLQKRLADELVQHEGKRIMLVAHSMGSIVAYDVLRDLGRTNPALVVDHLITLGSPLGMPYVLDRIRKENAAIRTPSMVRRWSNLADRRDFVAIDVHLGDDYEPNVRQVKVEDALVLNTYQSSVTGKRNHHKIYGYLRTPEFSEMVRTFI